MARDPARDEAGGDNVVDRLGATDLLGLLFDGAYAVDRELRITFWNAAAERMTGFGPSEVIGTRCADNVLMHVDEAGASLCSAGCPLSRTMADGEVREAAVFLRHKAGHRMEVRVRTSPVRDRDGRILGAIEVFTDCVPQVEARVRIAELERLAMVDSLTELPNRRYLEMTLGSRLSEWKRYGRRFGVLMLDLDEFKALNDENGHAAGDEALRMVARTLSAGSRPFDVVGRWGGEEFLAIVVEVDEARLREIGERFRVMIGRSVLGLEGGSLRITTSVGAALVQEDDDADSVIRRADERLYRAKRLGRNRLVHS